MSGGVPHFSPVLREVGTENLARNFEADRNLRLDLDRLTIQQIRTILPLPHCVCRRLRQNRVTAEYSDTENFPIFRDRGDELNRTLLAHLQCCLRINGSHFLNQQSL